MITDGKLLSDARYLNDGYAVDTSNCADARREFRAALICVDFNNAPASGVGGEESLPSYYDRILARDGARVFGIASYGRLKFTVDFYDKWFRMPKPDADYHMERVMTARDHRAYIADAMSRCRSEVPLSEYDALYIAAVKGSAVPYSPTLVDRRNPVECGGDRVGLAVTFGGDMHTRKGKLLAHETGHIFGLPDLYLFEGDAFARCGAYDLMGLIDGPAPDYLAWHKYRLGWLTEENVRVFDKSGEVRLTPVERDPRGSVSLAVIPIDDYTAYAVESRRAEGLDEKLGSAKGALVYYIDGHAKSGCGCVTVMPKERDKYMKLNPMKPEELFLPGETFADEERGVKIDFIATDDDTIRVTRLT